jgi:hypothetical protein
MAACEHIESIGQKPPFRYVDELISIDAKAREARFALYLNRETSRYGTLDGLQSYLLIEAMAQSSGVLLRALTVGEPGGYLVGLENTRLPETVSSSQIVFHVTMKVAHPPHFRFLVQIINDSNCIAESEIQIMSKRSFYEHPTPVY